MSDPANGGSVYEVLPGTDKLFVQQRFAMMVNRYTISTVSPDGQNIGQPLLHVQQKRMKIKEDIGFFADEGRTQLALRIKARSVFEVAGQYDVELGNGQVIGSLKKRFGSSLLRSTWELRDQQGTVVATAHEKSMFMAVLRRVWGLIPYAENIPFFLPFHFTIFLGEPGTQEVGTYVRIPALRDRYLLDLTGDPQRRIDRRLAAAWTVALDALQDR